MGEIYPGLLGDILDSTAPILVELRGHSVLHNTVWDDDV